MISCNEDVLDKEPLDSYTDESVWNDIKLTEAFANNLYNVLPTAQHMWSSKSNRSWALSSACDEGYNKFNDYNAAIMTSGSLTPDNIGIFDIWSQTFSTIQNCNIFLSHIDDVPGDDNLRNLLKGEVIYLRAYAYFKLTRDYGGVPLIETPFDLNSEFVVPRNTYQECVDFISGQLDDAADLLPVNQSSANYGRATKAAALALKSTTLLYAASPQWNPSNDGGKWEKASNAAKAVLDLDFNLYDGAYTDIFTTKNSELIMVRLTNKQYMWSAFQGAEMFLSPSGFHGWGSYVPSQNLVDAFGTADGKDITDPSSGYDPQNPYVNRDPRFNADIVYDGRPYGNPAYSQDRYAVGSTNAAEFFEGGLDSPQGWDTWNNSVTRYTFRKYCDTTYNYNVETQTNKFWIISRLSEIYLNYAEAQFYLGNEDVTIDYLNRVRERAGISEPLPTSLSGTELENKIRNERQVELCLEGHRYYDIRRWKIAEITENKPLMGVVITKNDDETKTYTYTQVQERSFKQQHYLLPIPREEINRTNLAQNPDYN